MYYSNSNFSSKFHYNKNINKTVIIPRKLKNEPAIDYINVKTYIRFHPFDDDWMFGILSPPYIWPQSSYPTQVFHQEFNKEIYYLGNSITVTKYYKGCEKLIHKLDLKYNFFGIKDITNIMLEYLDTTDICLEGLRNMYVNTNKIPRGLYRRSIKERISSKT